MKLVGQRRRAINLALQGGGAHGAFTWGVLDRLLEEPSLEISAISGTSSGALNAVALACGMVQGGTEGARAKLKDIWTAVGETAPPELSSLHPFQLGMNVMGELAGASAERLAKVFSPSQLNPLNIDPLRTIIEAHIDFDCLKKKGAIKLFVAATTVSTGRARIFDRHELSTDVVLASACLPTIHRAVEIGGAHYWDGGFSANPHMSSLVLKGQVQDSLLVQLEPLRVSELPTSARDIAGHMSWFAFNQPLQRELEMMHALRSMRVGYFTKDSSRLSRYKQHRFHHIDGGRHTSKLSAESKVRPDPKNLTALFKAGRNKAGRWIGSNAKHVGRRSSVSLGDLVEPKN